jgi:hypothetical protein
MASKPESTALTGHNVVDMHNESVGTVTDVLYDDRAATPMWAVVRTGRLSGEHFVPLEEAYLDVEGRLVVPFDKNDVKRAPRVRRAHILTPEARRELREHYGVAA